MYYIWYCHICKQLLQMHEQNEDFLESIKNVRTNAFVGNIRLKKSFLHKLGYTVYFSNFHASFSLYKIRIYEKL